MQWVLFALVESGSYGISIVSFSPSLLLPHNHMRSRMDGEWRKTILNIPLVTLSNYFCSFGSVNNYRFSGLPGRRAYLCKYCSLITWSHWCRSVPWLANYCPRKHGLWYACDSEASEVPSDLHCLSFVICWFLGHFLGYGRGKGGCNPLCRWQASTPSSSNLLIFIPTFLFSWRLCLKMFDAAGTLVNWSDSWEVQTF